MIDSIVILGASITALAIARTAAQMGMRVIMAHSQKGIAMHSKYGEKWVFRGSKPDQVLKDLRTALRGDSACCVADSDDWLKFIASNRGAFEAIFVSSYPVAMTSRK